MSPKTDGKFTPTTGSIAIPFPQGLMHRKAPPTGSAGLIYLGKEQVSGHLNLLGLANSCLHLREFHMQHACLVLRLDAVCVYLLREVEGALEATGSEFTRHIIVTRLLLILGVRTADGQHLIFNSDIDILLVETGGNQFEMEGSFVLADVHRGNIVSGFRRGKVFPEIIHNTGKQNVGSFEFYECYGLLF